MEDVSSVGKNSCLRHWETGEVKFGGWIDTGFILGDVRVGRGEIGEILG